MSISVLVNYSINEMGMGGILHVDSLYKYCTFDCRRVLNL